ncbi:MAG: hypothetical protein ACI3W5_15615 [Faecousia sp.]
MSRYMKKLKAGRYNLVTAYKMTTRYDCPKARAEKKNHTAKAQQLVNDRNSRIALTAIIAENFSDSKTAFFVTPSFDAEHYPSLTKKSEYWSFCCSEAKKYVKRLRRIAKSRGGDIKYVFSVGVGEGGRWHFHMLIDGVTTEDIRDVWGRGNVDYHHLYTDTKWVNDRDWYCKADNVNPVAIAKYMMNNASCRLVGQHPWHVSRNCVRPKAEPAIIISDNASIEPPDGAEVLDRETSETLYSAFQFIEYIEKKPATALKKPVIVQRRSRKSSKASQTVPRS